MLGIRSSLWTVWVVLSALLAAVHVAALPPTHGLAPLTIGCANTGAAPKATVVYRTKPFCVCWSLNGGYPPGSKVFLHLINLSTGAPTPLTGTEGIDVENACFSISALDSGAIGRNQLYFVKAVAFNSEAIGFPRQNAIISKPFSTI
ncbi:hypothetical protein CXG81DRAFT_23919 [Caulochytrium protostelioides]|uniref:Uncharacterized protein n=1 Tax=Caulochytrium protostelioides TaxID=1555241 RepID=A0A4P9XD72_9FUNG|nr:hypothetical protein CXG81DRAFT_23919 [Caulochytrium protostelioides]|eukprot:RKP03393.1 hypothetical protein CXG81DRAFT_23919 [Caulochytrium protostelioides]